MFAVVIARAGTDGSGTARHLCVQVAASAVFLSMATIAGWYHRHTRDLAQSESFASTQECIQARIKLEYEKEQQVRTLTSCDPWNGVRAFMWGAAVLKHERDESGLSVYVQWKERHFLSEVLSNFSFLHFFWKVVSSLSDFSCFLSLSLSFLVSASKFCSQFLLHD